MASRGTGSGGAGRNPNPEIPPGAGNPAPIVRVALECNICVGYLDEPVPPTPEEQHLPPPAGPIELAATHCGHLFHAKCLYEWFSTRDRNNQPRTCTTCRETVQPENITRMFSANAGPAPDPAPPVDDGDQCPKQHCQDILACHLSVTKDYQDLEQKCKNLEYENEIKEATIRSQADELQRFREAERNRGDVAASEAAAGPSTAVAGPSTAVAEPSTAVAGPAVAVAGPSRKTRKRKK